MIEPAPEVLADALEESRSSACNRLDARTLAERRMLCIVRITALRRRSRSRRPRSGSSGRVAAFGEPRAGAPRAARRRSRHEEMVEATKIALAACPGED